MTDSQLDLMMAESGIEPDQTSELGTLLAALTDLVPRTVEPSVALRAVLGETSAVGSRVPVPRVGRSPRGRGAIASAVVLALSGVGATGLSAAANTLPSPLQHEVSQFSDHHLPFDFPEPARSHRQSLRVPNTFQVPTPTTGSGERAERADRDSAEPTRSIQRPRRAMSAAPAWGGRPAGHVTTRRASSAAGYSRPHESGDHAPGRTNDRGDLAVSADRSKAARQDDSVSWADRRHDGPDDRTQDRGQGRGHGPETNRDPGGDRRGDRSRDRDPGQDEHESGHGNAGDAARPAPPEGGPRDEERADPGDGQRAGDGDGARSDGGRELRAVLSHPTGVTHVLDGG